MESSAGRKASIFSWLSINSITIGKSVDTLNGFATCSRLDSKAHRTSENGRASQAHLARLENDGFVQRVVPIPVIFTDEYSKQNGFFWDFHN